MGTQEPDVPQAPKFQGSEYKFGDETKSKTYKQGDNVITQFNPTANEKQSYDYLQGQLPSLYKDATTGQNFDEATANWVNNQKTAVNQDYMDGLKTFKGSMVTSGQMKDSQALDQLRPMQTSYLKSMQDIEANAPTYANDLRSNDLNYKTSVLGNAVNGLNNFYNNGNTFNSNATALSKFGNDWANTNFNQQNTVYANELAANQRKQQQTMDYIKMAAQIAGAAASGGATMAGGGGGGSIDGTKLVGGGGTFA